MTYMVTGPIDAIIYVNQLTVIGGIPLLSTGILIVIWLMIYFMNRNEGTRDSIVGASFVVSIIGMFFRIIGSNQNGTYITLVPDNVFAMCAVLFILSLVGLFNRQNGGQP